jgi:hypothetical protein
MKLFKCLIKKNLHSNSDFHFGLINIFSKHFNIPLQNSWRWEITQHAINAQNQQFFRLKKQWM